MLILNIGCEGIIQRLGVDDMYKLNIYFLTFNSHLITVKKKAPFDCLLVANSLEHTYVVCLRIYTQGNSNEENKENMHIQY